MTFRHFVLSAAAVFFALAVGVVLGARVLPGAIGPVLGGQPSELRTEVDTLTADKAKLDEKLRAAEEFDTAVAGRVVREALTGKAVALFRTPDAADEVVSAIAGLIGRAGGTVAGTIRMTTEFVDGSAAEKLRSVVNSPVVPAGTRLNPDLVDPTAQAGDLLGIAILRGRDPAAPAVGDDARDIVLTTLRDTGFLTTDAPVGAADAAVVITGGALAQDAGNQGAAVARFAAALAAHGTATVLAGGAGSDGEVSAVGVVRADPALTAAVSTVDDAGAEAGRITTVLAVQAMLGGSPPGQYGVGRGANAVTVAP